VISSRGGGNDYFRPQKRVGPRKGNRRENKFTESLQKKKERDSLNLPKDRNHPARPGGGGTKKEKQLLKDRDHAKEKEEIYEREKKGGVKKKKGTPKSLQGKEFENALDRTVSDGEPLKKVGRGRFGGRKKSICASFHANHPKGCGKKKARVS